MILGFNDAELARIAIAKFNSAGRNGVWLCSFAALAPGEQAWLQQTAALAPGELPIAGGRQINGNWILLTTRRLVVGTDSQARTIDPADIGQVWVDLHMMRAQGIMMDRLTELKLTLAGGDVVNLDLEPGYPLSGFWNALNRVVWYHQRYRDR